MKALGSLILAGGVLAATASLAVVTSTGAGFDFETASVEERAVWLQARGRAIASVGKPALRKGGGLFAFDFDLTAIAIRPERREMLLTVQVAAPSGYRMRRSERDRTMRALCAVAEATHLLEQNLRLTAVIERPDGPRSRTVSAGPVECGVSLAER